MSREPAVSPSGSESGSPPKSAGTQPSFPTGNVNVTGDARAVPPLTRPSTPASVQRMNCLVRPAARPSFGLPGLVISTPDIVRPRGCRLRLHAFGAWFGLGGRWSAHEVFLRYDRELHAAVLLAPLFGGVVAEGYGWPETLCGEPCRLDAAFDERLHHAIRTALRELHVEGLRTT